MRRKSPTPTEAAAYEAAGQQCFDGIAPLPERKLTPKKRVAEQALAVTKHTYKIFKELPAEVAAARAEPALEPGMRHAPRRLTKLEWTALAAQWTTMFFLVAIVIFRADVSEFAYAIKLTKMPRTAIIGMFGIIAIMLAVATTIITFRWAYSALRPSTDWIARLSRSILIVIIVVLLQLPSFVSISQSREATWRVIAEIVTNVMNDITIPAWDMPAVTPKAPR